MSYREAGEFPLHKLCNCVSKASKIEAAAEADEEIKVMGDFRLVVAGEEELVKKQTSDRLSVALLMLRHMQQQHSSSSSLKFSLYLIVRVSR